MFRRLLRVAVGIFAVLTCYAHADTISGPLLDSASNGYTTSGISFTAKVNSTLNSFTYRNEGLADTVILMNSTGSILDSISVPAHDPTDNVIVNWSLVAGQQYYLLQTAASNSYYGNWGIAAPSDTQIALNLTYIYATSTNPANFYLTGTQIWAAFDNITTTSDVNPTPEPSSILLLGTGSLGAVVLSLRRRRLA